MSATSRLAKADTRIVKAPPKPSPKPRRPRDENGKFLPKPLLPEFVCPKCRHVYWWAGSVCTGVLAADGSVLHHSPALVAPITASTSTPGSLFEPVNEVKA